MKLSPFERNKMVFGFDETLKKYFIDNSKIILNDKCIQISTFSRLRIFHYLSQYIMHRLFLLFDSSLNNLIGFKVMNVSTAT